MKITRPDPRWWVSRPILPSAPLASAHQLYRSILLDGLDPVFLRLRDAAACASLSTINNYGRALPIPPKIAMGLTATLICLISRPRRCGLRSGQSWHRWFITSSGRGKLHVSFFWTHAGPIWRDVLERIVFAVGKTNQEQSALHELLQPGTEGCSGAHVQQARFA